jgi:hypothetical protein
MRLPKIPKGLKTAIAKLERKELAQKKVNDRKKLIADLKKKKEALQKKLSR